MNLLTQLLTFAHNWRPARIFIIGLRIVLGLAFVYPSIPKLKGENFTVLQPGTHPMADFFYMIYHMPLWWHSIGVFQITAGILLITQRYAHIGCILYLGLLANIFPIVLDLNMRGTPYVVALMICGILTLMLWDWHKYRSLLFPQPSPYLKG